MKFLVFLALCFGVSQTVSVSTEVKTKMSPKGNAIPVPHKTELYYPQTNQPSQTDFMPVHVMQKPLFYQQPQQHPQTMLIIAQPAYVPQNVLYGNQPGMQQQQLLNYFHGNPQAKYQLLFGGYQPHPTPQPYIPQHPLPASTVPAYQIVPNPVFNGFNHLVGAPAQMNFNQVPAYQPNQMAPQYQAAQYVQPMQLNQLAHLAQMAAQQYSSPHQFGSQIRSVPPIITGFENFTPEQQVQIKAQLSAHLGTPLTTATSAPATTNQYTSPISTQTTQSLNTHDFMQHQDKHAPQGSATSFTPSLLYRAQYTKG